jgi:hypothetical protein
MSIREQSDSNSNQDSNRAIELEIRQGRKFSIADAIGKEGGSFMKGESPVPKLLQVKNELIGFVGYHLQDPAGALHAVLRDLIQSDDIVCSRNFETPLVGLIELLQPLLSQKVLLYEFVRQVDMRWGQIYGERPHFQRPGHPPHPDDEYTHESVHHQLNELLLAAKAQQTR